MPRSLPTWPTVGDSHSWGPLHQRRVQPHRLHQPGSGHHWQQTARSEDGQLGETESNKVGFNWHQIDSLHTSNDCRHKSLYFERHLIFPFRKKWSHITFIVCIFTVSGFDRTHKVRSNYHWSEANVTVKFPHQWPECQPGKVENKRRVIAIAQPTSAICTKPNCWTSHWKCTKIRQSYFEYRTIGAQIFRTFPSANMSIMLVVVIFIDRTVCF